LIPSCGFTPVGSRQLSPQGRKKFIFCDAPSQSHAIIGYDARSVNRREETLSPIGHLQYGWWFAHWRKFDRGERAAIALAGAACDLDGLSMFGGSDVYYRYHHMLFHNVGSVLVVIPLAGLIFWRRAWAWLAVVFAFGMHIVEDYFSIPWDMKPWAPFNAMVTNLDHHISAPIVQYGFQTAIMVFILGVTVWIYHRYERTPLEIISPAFDRLIMNYALLPFRNRCTSCGHRAHFRCDQCGKGFCAEHAKPGRGCKVVCSSCAGQTGPAAKI
jgi:hypothetical protein